MAVLGALFVFGATLVLADARAPGAAAAPTSSEQAQVAIGPELAPVPPSFLGVSVEANEIPRYEHWFRAFVRLLSVLQPPGDASPVILRIGGESADSSVWEGDQDTLVAPMYRQRHAYKLTDQWMADVGSLVRAASLKLILDLNLAAHSPKMAADEAASARRNLPAHSLIDIEVGNEPDNYVRGYVGYTRARRGETGDWAYGFTRADYTRLFSAYVRAVSHVFPGAPFAGPSGADRSPEWTNSLLSSPAGRHVSLVTVHAYPAIRTCLPPTNPDYPTVRAYLRDGVAQGVANSLRYVISASLVAHRPVRLTEVGSSTCGGLAGRTDTFATALWAPDLLFSLLAAGVDGVNIHMRANGYANTALLDTTSGLYPEPMFYGMTLFTRALGPGATLMQVQRRGGPERLKVWAVRLGDGSLRVVYINKSAYSTSISLLTRLNRPGVVERLSAPSLRANSTVTLAGQRFTRDGHWHGRLATERVPGQAGDHRVTLPAFSAALVSIPAG